MWLTSSSRAFTRSEIPVFPTPFPAEPSVRGLSCENCGKIVRAGLRELGTAWAIWLKPGTNILRNLANMLCHLIDFDIFLREYGVTYEKPDQAYPIISSISRKVQEGGTTHEEVLEYEDSI
jgi:hypothetical protein